MNAARAGWHLKVDIRIALLSLKRDPHGLNLSRKSIPELKDILAALRAEQRAVSGILKEGV